MFRAVQGIGGGILIPVGMAMMFRAFPPAERIRANRLLIVPTLVAPALGPVIGGVLVDGLSWRWIFYVNVPVGVAALAFGAAVPAARVQHPAGRFDLPGFLLAGAGFPLLMYALSTGATSGWAAPHVLASGMPACCCSRLPDRRTACRRADAAAADLRQPAVPHHESPARVRRAGFIGTLFLVPLLLQNGLGFSALHSGLSTFPEAMGGMAGVQVTTRLYKRVGPRQADGRRHVRHVRRRSARCRSRDRATRRG